MKDQPSTFKCLNTNLMDNTKKCLDKKLLPDSKLISNKKLHIIYNHLNNEKKLPDSSYLEYEIDTRIWEDKYRL